MAETRPVDDEAHLRAIRAALPAVLRRVYLNTGTAGPLPQRAADVIVAELAREVDRGRAELADFERVLGAMASLRAAFARLVGADPDEIALARHSTDGINVVLWGLNWQPGDELLTTSLEHEGALVPAAAAARRFGLDLRVADIGLGDEPGAVLAAIDAALGPRTRLVLVSHVTWNSGAVLPLAEIVSLAHRRGALVLVDGAQSVGALPLDLHALGADFYTVSGQKWLCGPEGAGALYVRRDRLSLVRQTFAGYLSLRDFESWSAIGDFLPAPGARRFEVGTTFRPLVHAMLESLRFLDEDVGWGYAHARIRANAARARALVASVPGARVLTPAASERHAGLVAFTVDGPDPEAVVRALALRDIVIRSVPLGATSVLRAATGFYNTDEELVRLRDALVEACAARR